MVCLLPATPRQRRVSKPTRCRMKEDGTKNSGASEPQQLLDALMPYWRPELEAGKTVQELLPELLSDADLRRELATKGMPDLMGLAARHPEIDAALGKLQLQAYEEGRIEGIKAGRIEGRRLGKGKPAERKQRGAQPITRSGRKNLMLRHVGEQRQKGETIVKSIKEFREIMQKGGVKDLPSLQ